MVGHTSICLEKCLRLKINDSTKNEKEKRKFFEILVNNVCIKYESREEKTKRATKMDVFVDRSKDNCRKEVHACK